MTQKTNTNEHELTKEQKEIIRVSSKLGKNEILQVTACAGSGKTSTLNEVARANPEKTFLYLAFNKAAAADASKKFPRNVEVRTVHSTAFKEMVSKGPYKGREITNIRAYDVMRAFETNKYFFARDILEKYEEYLHSDETEPEPAAEMLYKMVEEGKLPLTHDHYLKAFQLQNLKSKNFGKNYDYIMLDEAQDSNDVTMSLFLNNRAKRIIVGDPNQQIYAFRGAINIMEKVEANEDLTLSTSFRCPKEVIDRCNLFIRKYKPSSFIEMTATHNGGIRYEPEKKTAYLSRSNARLISCFSLLSDTGNMNSVRFERDPDRIFMPALCVLDFIRGEKPRSKEMSFIENFEDMNELSKYATDTNDTELCNAINIAKGFKSQLEPLHRAALECYRRQGRENRIISLSTAHSAKGLEWDNVIILDDFTPLKEYMKDLVDGKITQEQMDEEVNLYYVTCTRSLSNIVDATENMDELLEMNRIGKKEYMENMLLSEKLVKNREPESSPEPKANNVQQHENSRKIAAQQDKIVLGTIKIKPKASCNA